MADIELVIKIDEEDYKIMQHNIAVNNPLCPLSEKEMVSKIASGIPLPKGHRDLIDRSDLLEYTDISVSAYIPTISRYDIITAPTIIPADKE